MPHGVMVINELKRAAFDARRIALVRIQFAVLIRDCFGHEVILYQNRSQDYQSGYFAVVTLLDADVSRGSPKCLSVILTKPRYLTTPVPLKSGDHVAEHYIKNVHDNGINGRRAAEDFRLITTAEFNGILAQQDFESDPLVRDFPGLAEAEDRIRERVASESWLRSVKVRAIALPPYEFSCAITRQTLPSLDGTRSGLEVCHAKSVASGGPDIAANLFPCCPDFHSRYDQGTIDILDDYSWVPIGDFHDPIVLNWHGPRRLFVPKNPTLRLAPEFLAAHRQEIFDRFGVDCRMHSGR